MLLNWTEKEFTTIFKNGGVIRTQSNKIKTVTDLISVLDKRVIDESLLHGWHAEASIQGGGYGKTPVPHVVTPPWEHLLEQSLLAEHTISSDKPRISDISPLLITIDEAQNLTGEVAVTIANLAQGINRSNAQICFILAGTPELLNHLSSVGPKEPTTGKSMTATFVERSGKIYPDLLDKDASREALLKPFHDNNWQVDEAVQAEILDDAQGYPWFIQLWGEELWDNGLSNKTINRAVMEAAREKVDDIRTRIYQSRLDELNEPLNADIEAKQVLVAVSKVADYYLSHDNAPLPESELTQILITLEDSGISSNDHKSLKMRFLHTGFLVENPISKKMYWRIGIPSLASYIVESTSHLVSGSEHIVDEVQEQTTELPKP